MSKLILMFKNMILNAYPLNEGEGLTIGRHPENDIVIQNLAVSGHHARIDRRDGHIQLTDLNSKNGTFLNGKSIRQSILKDGDTIVIGKHSLRADWTDTMDVDHTDTAYEPGPSDLARTIIMDSDPQARSDADTLAELPESLHPLKDCLLFLSGGQGEIALSQQVTIGKNDDADIVVGGPMALMIGAPAVIISKQAGNYFLRFAGGWIKPRRNGKSIRGTVKLSHEDIVDIGPVRVQVQLSERPATSSGF
jgi:predicted component of type VI protein secretion system